VDDRLAIILNEADNVTLVGYRTAKDKETADLERGFPCAGRWRMDYVDNIGTYDNAVDYAQSLADALWGTIAVDGEILVDGLLTWHQDTNAPEIALWATRDKDKYERACLDAFQHLDSPYVFI
jgi:hypothetical protein